MKKYLLFFIVFIVSTLSAQTSKFMKYFSTTKGLPLRGATIWVVPQANTYPTNAIRLTAHPTRTGIYYKDGLKDGEYKIYIDLKGGLSPSLFEERVWVGENKLSIMSSNFNEYGQILGTGISSASITEAKIAPSLMDIINSAGGGTIVNHPDESTIRENLDHTLSVIGIPDISYTFHQDQRFYGKARFGDDTSSTDENFLVKYARTDSLPFNQYNLRSTYVLKTKANTPNIRVGGVLGEAYGDPSFEGAIQTLAGLYGYSNNYGQGVVGNGISVLGFVAHRSGHIMVNAAGFDYTVINQNGGVIQNSYGVIIKTPVVTEGSTIDHNYGLYVQDQTATGVTDNWGVYQAGFDDKNYLAGALNSNLTFAANYGVVAKTNTSSVSLAGGTSPSKGSSISLYGGATAGFEGRIYIDIGNRDSSISGLHGADLVYRLNHDGGASILATLTKAGNFYLGPDTATGIGRLSVGDIFTAGVLRMSSTGDLYNIDSISSGAIVAHGNISAVHSGSSSVTIGTTSTFGGSEEMSLDFKCGTGSIAGRIIVDNNSGMDIRNRLSSPVSISTSDANKVAIFSHDGSLTLGSVSGTGTGTLNALSAIFGGGVTVGTSSSTRPGTIRTESGHLQFYNGSSWVQCDN